uniref:Uncharacterized protein n=1 Tax=Romanomermis culicivorax TaxID=13658 RepID=A0A915JRB7_ROMCU
MQQLISTTTAAALARNPHTPRPLPVTSRFHGQEPPNIYIPNETLHETEPALVFGCPPAHIKPKAPSTDTLYNHQFSCTARGKDEFSHATPQRRQLPGANPFGFWATHPKIIMIIRNLSMTCRACLTAKKIAESKKLSTICIRLQSMDPQTTNTSSAKQQTPPPLLHSP